MVISISHSSIRRRLSQLMMRPAVTLLELLCAVVVFGVLAGGGTAIYDGYMRAQRANQVAELLRWEITVARSYAVRTGRPMTLLIDEEMRSVTLRDGLVTRRFVQLGDAARLRVERLDLQIPGDSLVFSARGLCVNCPTAGFTELSIEAEGRTATVQVELLGRPAVSATERAGGE
jgi:prepilin-type N-terminal cleavage/methylation domain-containing protein